MDPQFLVLVFLLAGIILIFAELFVPSGGAIALMCAFCFLVSGFYAYRSWYETAPLYWWSYVAAIVVLIPSTVIGGFQFILKTPLGNRVLMPAPTTEEVTPYLEEQARLEKLIGHQGEALNLMTPGGMVLVNGERFHASSDGLLIEAGTPVEVVEVRGNRLVVREIPPVENQREFDSFATTELPPPIEPIDPWSPEEETA